jgi:hypothetical protein
MLLIVNSSHNTSQLLVRFSPYVLKIDHLAYCKKKVLSLIFCSCSQLGWVSFLLSFYRSALDKKKVEEKKTYQAIDYDAPVESDKSTIGFGTRVSISIHLYRVFTIW